MKTSAVAAILGACVLAFAGAAAAGPNIGFAEDATKYAEDGGAHLFDGMSSFQTTTNRVAVFWNADAPSTIQDQAFLDRMIPVAQSHDIQVVFAIYPMRATMAPTSQSAADAFCAYAVKVMQRYPYVRKVIVGNEPNQPKFWQPIWNGSQPASPAALAVVLASCYDKLKAFDPSLDVIAAGLSPRGNDNPGASSNSSISPVRFIAALGEAYRAMGRKLPLFDSWSWHCYPNANDDEVETGYAWPNTGCVNAARVKLALWDAFNGTAQPQPEGYAPDTTGSTLFGNVAKTFIDETGWQVDTNGRPGYVNNENVPVVAEAKQADNYAKLVRLANCDPTLTDFHIFHEIDESDRGGFQSGALRVDDSVRDAGGSMRDAIAADGGQCSGGVWQRLGTFLYSSSAVVPDYAGFPYQGAKPYAATTISGGGKYVTLDAGEGFTYAIAFRSGSKSANASGAAPKMSAAVKVPTGFGTGTATVVLKAETNPSRSSSVTLSLGSGNDKGSHGKKKRKQRKRVHRH
ncbi:MAG TPA: hypothetical protein VFI10_00590 [Gaiellaceae bacterium]|nr:hypothetical protein [Gaiellaceae bacterium]